MTRVFPWLSIWQQTCPGRSPYDRIFLRTSPGPLFIVGIRGSLKQRRQ
jgi:hypothetical protein